MKYVEYIVPNIVARQIPADPPKPVPPPPAEDKAVDDSVILAPKAPVDLARNDTLRVPDVPDIVMPQVPDIPDIDVRPPVTPDPPPRFTPVRASPRGNPGAWVSTNDYPARDLREGNQGAVGFRLDISASGKITDCRITSSSGHPRLDAATCRLLEKRAKFDPATNATGSKVAGTYANTVRWVIPD